MSGTDKHRAIPDPTDYEGRMWTCPQCLWRQELKADSVDPRSGLIKCELCKEEHEAYARVH